VEHGSPTFPDDRKKVHASRRELQQKLRNESKEGASGGSCKHTWMPHFGSKDIPGLWVRRDAMQCDAMCCDAMRCNVL